MSLSLTVSEVLLRISEN